MADNQNDMKIHSLVPEGHFRVNGVCMQRSEDSGKRLTLTDLDRVVGSLKLAKSLADQFAGTVHNHHGKPVYKSQTPLALVLQEARVWSPEIEAGLLRGGE